MAVRRTLRTAAALVAATTVALAAGPLTGIAAAAAPVLATDGRVPAAGSTVQPPATITACFTGPIAAVPLSSISVMKGSSPVVGTPPAGAVGNCGSGTGNALVFTPDDALTDGIYDVTATATDPAPPFTQTTVEWSFTVDGTAPTAPNTLTLSSPVFSGNVTTVVVTGKTDANTPVAVAVRNHPTPAATATGSTTSDGSGNFTVSGLDVSALADGAIRATATATDALGNSSQGTIDGTKDTVAPVRTATTPAHATTSQTRSTVIVTFDQALDTAASALVVKNGGNNTVGGTSAFSNGNQTITFTSTSPMTPAGGTFSVTANVADIAGNTSSSLTTFSIDNTGPAAPTVVLTDPVNAANVATSVVSGVAEAGSTVNVSVDDSVPGSPALGSGPAHATTGAYSVSVDLTPLLDGEVTATAVATDFAGNGGATGTSDASTKDTVVPGTPTVSMDTPVTNASKTVVNVSGVAEAGSSVAISVNDETPGTGAPVTTTVPAHATTGAYAAVLDLSSLSDGDVTASLVATDAAGNPSAAGTDVSDKDTGLPAAPVLNVTNPVNNANQTNVVASGTTEPGATVSVSITDGVNLPLTASPVAAGDGTYTTSFDVSTFNEGTLTATAAATDVNGNPGPTTTVNGIVKDTIVPGAPALNLPAFVNNATKATVPVSGTAEPASTVTIVLSDSDGGTPNVTVVTVAAPNGSYSTTANVTTLVDGTLNGSATATDSVGNVSGAGTDSTVKDVVKPATPTVALTNPIVPANVATSAVSGSAETGTEVDVSVNDTDPATAAVNGSDNAASGSYEVPVDLTSLTDGSITATATSTDAAGNVSDVGTSAASAKDTIVLDDVSTSPVHGSTVQPPATISMTFNEVVDPTETTITLADASTSVLAGATTFTNGNKTVVLTPVDTLSDAGSPYTVSVDAKDADGTDGLVGAFTFTVDGTAPAMPSIDIPSVVNAAGDGAVVVSGVAEPGSSVLVSVDDATPGSPVTDTEVAHATTGAYSTTLDLTALADGAITATAVATDAVGNASAAGTDTATKDATPPAAPTVTMPAYVNDANKAAVVVSGVAEPASSVAVSVDDATPGSPVTSTVTAHATTGAYTTTVDLTALADGALSATAAATDAALNTGSTGSTTSNKDVAAPSAPTVTLADVNVANVGGVVLSGTAEALSTVGYVVSTSADGTTDSGSTTAAADGAWSVTRNLSGVTDGTLTATVTATDAAGNASTNGTDSALKDATAPGAPTVTLADPVNAGNVTTAVVSGVAEPGSTVSVSVDDATPGTPVAQSPTAHATTGAYSVTLDVSTLDDGTLTATVSATDGAGNTGATATDTATKDVGVPGAPVIATPAPVTHATYLAAPFSGTAEPGSTVTVTVDDTDVTTDPVTGQATADGNGDWTKSLDLSTLDDGVLTVTAATTDPSGNTGASDSDTVAKNVTRAFTISVSATPRSGTAQASTVTAHTTHDPASAVDTAYAGTPVLSSLDGHFTAGSCVAAVNGVASCSGTVFGDLGPQQLIATSGTGNDFVTGSASVVVQATALAFSVLPPATATPGQTIAFTVVPVVGVSGATITGYSRTRTLATTGGSTPPTGSILSCPTATCSGSVTFATRGPKTIRITDNSTPSVSTPTATVTIPYATSLTLSRSKFSVPAGSTVTLSGKLTNTTLATPVGGKTINLYRKTAPSTTFAFFGSVTTSSTGVWSKTVGLSRNTMYQARFAAQTSYLAANSLERLVKASQVVTTAWSLSGRTVTVSGKVSPSGSAGKPIYLHVRRADGSWASIAKATISSTNGYKLSRAFLPGTYTLRVYVPATTKNTAGYSALKTIKVT